MKIKNLFLSGLACLAMTACSNNDDVTNSIDQDNKSSYMAVNLTMASGSNSRATTDGGYENGSDIESAVKIANANFYFYGADGAYITTGTVATTQTTETGKDPSTDGFLTLTENATDNPNSIHKESNALIVLGPTQTKPAYVIAVLNSTESFDNKSMTEIYNELTSETAISTSKGDFVMTNSTYFDSNDKLVYAQAIGDKIKENVTDAVANPVDIYVERIVSKVKMTNSTDNNALEFVLNGEENQEVLDAKVVKMKVVIDGWKINALNTKSYFIKHLSNTTSLYDNGLNISTQYRSFWAEDMNYSGDSDNYDGDTYTNLKYYTFADVTDKSGNYEYCYENTVAPSNVQAEGGDRANTPCMLIAAHVVYSTDGGTNWEDPIDLFRYNGQLYTLDTYKNLYLNALKNTYSWKKTENNVTETADLAVNDITWSVIIATDATTSKDNFKKVRLTATAISKEGYTLYNGENAVTTENELSTINNTLAQTDMATKTEGYKDGKCYYQVPIEHLFSQAEQEKYGIVRNHIYNLTLTGVTKIGDAVYFPNEELEYIPGERKNYYVAARLNILTWRVVNQSVEL